MLRTGLLLLLPTILCAVALHLDSRRDAVEQRGTGSEANAVAGGSVEFTVATYNVQGRPVLDGTARKFPLISPLLNGFDIVGVQECFQDHARLWGRATHRTKLYHGRLKAPWKAAGSGLSTLARFPMLETRAEFFRTAAELQNKLASKGMTMVRLDLHGKTLDLYNAHFDAGSSSGAHRSRAEQGRQLAAFVRANSPPEHSVIVVGDFNMGPERPGKSWKDFDPLWYHSERDARTRTRTFERMVRELRMRDAAEVLHGGGALDDIDRVIFRAGDGHVLDPLGWSRATERFVDGSGRPLSDHAPIVVRMRLSSAG